MSVVIAYCKTCGVQFSGPFLNCLECRAANQARVDRYRRSARGKATARAWIQSQAGKQSSRKRQERHRQRPGVAERTAARRRTVEGRAYARLCTQKYRAKKRGTQILPIRAVDLRGKLAMYHDKCWICKSAPWAEWDHVKPLNKSGPHILSNLRPACRSCNRSKRDTWPFPVTPLPRRHHLP